MRAALLVSSLALLLLGSGGVGADEGRVFRCATPGEVRTALESAGPGDTILLEGGTRYEIDRSFRLRASGGEGKPIRFTSNDPSGQGRYALITTVEGKKEPDLTAIRVLGAYWELSRLEIGGTRVDRGDGYWDTNGFQLGIYLMGAGSHHNAVEDVHIHHTHNAAVAVRDESHHNTFRRLNIHDVGEWLDEGYNAHEAEGFYIGSSKGVAEAGNKARVHDILIENSVVGPGVLGQYVDIKYGASGVSVRDNVFHCGRKTYNEEIIKVAGFGNHIEGNRFIGSNPRLTRYIHIFTRKTRDPVRVDYGGSKDVPVPSGRDNTVVNNVFIADVSHIRPVDIDVESDVRSSLRVEGNRLESPDGNATTKRNNM